MCRVFFLWCKQGSSKRGDDGSGGGGADGNGDVGGELMIVMADDEE